MFSTIMAKIFGPADAARPAQAAATMPGTAGPTSQATAAQSATRSSAPAAAAPPAGPAQAPPQAVHVEAVLARMASDKGGGGNWQTSIVDLLKLLDLDSSLDARKELAQELDVHAGPHRSAEQTSRCTRRSCASSPRAAARSPTA